MQVISAREAFEAGLTRYFTGAPCSQGHIEPRLVCNGACTSCAHEITRKWKSRNKDKIAEYERARQRHNPSHVADLSRKRSLSYRARHLDKVRKSDAELHQRLRKANPGRERERQRVAKEKLHQARLLIAGRPKPEQCEICDLPGKIVFDHCHVGGHFRGWICENCNKTLGLAKDNPVTLQKMINYLNGSSTNAKTISLLS